MGGVAQLDPPALAAVRSALVGGFHSAFIVCAALMAAALLACVRLRELPLRSSEGR
jgi:hypothetical protein